MANPEAFAKCPRTLIRSKVSDAAVRLYLILRTYDGDSGCFPAQATLASDLGATDRAVRKYLAELRVAGWISWKVAYEQTGSGTQRKCRYMIHESPRATGTHVPVVTDTNRNTRSGSSDLPEHTFRHNRNVRSRPTGTHVPNNKTVLTRHISRNGSASSDARDDDFALSSEAPPKPSPKAQQAEWFTAFWAAYWRKRGKGQARTTFSRLVKSEADFTLVMSGLEADRPAMLAREETYRPYASTWLKAEDWRNPPEEPATASATATDTKIDWRAM